METDGKSNSFAAHDFTLLAAACAPLVCMRKRIKNFKFVRSEYSLYNYDFCDAVIHEFSHV